MDTLTRIGFWYLGPYKEWEERLYGFEIRSGIGDLISNNTRLIMRTKDRSPWAYECLEECFDLLRLKKRWPDYMDVWIPKDKQCQTRLCTFLNKFKFHFWKWIKERRKKRGKTTRQITIKYRSQGDLTRDPYANALACAVDLDRLQFVHTISIPWYLWRPATWTFHKYLKDPTEKRYKRWERAERLSAMFNAPDFVQGLKQRRREAVEKIYLNQ